MIRKIVLEQIDMLNEAFELDFSSYKLENSYNAFYTSVGQKTYDIEPFIVSEDAAIAMNFTRSDVSGYGETNDSQIRDITQVLSSCYEAFICYAVAKSFRLKDFFPQLKSFGYVASKKGDELYNSDGDTARSRLYTAFIRKNFGSIISGTRISQGYEYFDFKNPIDCSSAKVFCEQISQFPYFDKIMSRQPVVKATYLEFLEEA